LLQFSKYDAVQSDDNAVTGVGHLIPRDEPPKTSPGYHFLNERTY